MRPLAERLYLSATRFVGLAMQAFAEQQFEAAFLHAGTGLEHLAKARLAEINPLLIADGKLDSRILLWLADDAKHNQPPPAGLRTIGLERAIELVSHRSSIGSHRKQLDQLRQLRNGIAHLGATDEADTQELVPGYLAAILELATGLVDPPNEVFGVHKGVAAVYLTNHGELEARVLAVRLAEARARFDAKYPDADSRVLAAVSQSLTDARHETRVTMDEQLAACPVCGLPANLDGDLVVGWDVEADFGADGPEYHAFPIGEFKAYSLRCPTCGLVLDAPSLIDRSGALENWILPDADLRTAVEEHNESMADDWWAGDR